MQKVMSFLTFTCKQCERTLPLDSFPVCRVAKRGHRLTCVDCQRSYQKEKAREYRAKIPVEERRAKHRARYHANADYYRKRAMDNIRKDPEKSRKRHREWSSRNKRQVADYARNRHQTDVQARLRTNTNSRIRYALKRLGLYKEDGTLKLLGCTGDALATYLTSLFKPGMTWENYGRWKSGQSMTWHIDHIRPCSSFDLTDPAQRTLCFHYTNLQPLWAIDNLRKNDSYTPPDPTLS